MRFDLRKGQSGVYLVYVGGSGDSLGAKGFELCVEGDVAVIRFQLSPVDENQRIDECRLHSESLSEIHIADDYIIENLRQFLGQPYVTAKELRVQIVSQAKLLDYTVSFGAAGLDKLPLLVTRVAS